MKNLILGLGISLFAITALAESHGGVRRSNALFEAVSKYALEEGGNLSRVMEVKKVKNCLNLQNAALFRIKFGGMDNKGAESVYEEETQLVLANEAAEDGNLWGDPEKVQVTFTTTKCK